jgi:NADPH2:quinone reductase
LLGFDKHELPNHQECQMSQEIPKIMQAVQLDEGGGQLTVRQVPVPEPGPGQVLVRMAASPINPSDLGFLAGSHGVQRTYPVTPGIEGSGTVVAAGAGWLPGLLKGRRVACARSSISNGAWAEFMVTRASLCVPLQKSLTLEQGAMLFVNPMTAVAFFDLVKHGRHAAVVNSAAASQLGRMLQRLTSRRGVALINIVRRKEQVGILEALGARDVLVSSEPDFDQKLSARTHQLNATLLLDAIAGDFTQRLIDAAPPNSLILLYSNLSREPAKITPHSLWTEGKRVEGFYLATWAARQNFLKILHTAHRVQKLAASDLRSEIRQRLPLSAAQKALELYQKDMTAGKLLLLMESHRPDEI